MRRVNVLEVIPQAADTQTLRLDAPAAFRAGQAVALLIAGDSKKRYYSISSSPTEVGHLDLTIKAPLHTPLFETLFSIKAGDAVEISEPMGAFTLATEPTGPIYFLCAGSGVTPFRSMIKYLLDMAPAVETWLFHSVRTPDDLLFKDEFISWGTASNRFHYVPTFTRYEPTVEGFESGRIEQRLLQKHLPLLDGTFFICGPQAFVGDMEKLLRTDLKIPAEKIRREQWETAKSATL